ncbi:transcription factor Ouib [Drosophila gunungcola]|uniref:transcription factor Ouib n=1 Tax=Drosophila elegans TaxID=30023 RepID=UPI0007E646AD|nr:transcription factor Ouib [Drosophila elegans]XP_052836677.1 transcription factor Ouib [Drosophila gunungcola]
MSKSALKHLKSTCRVCGKYASNKRSPKIFERTNTKMIDNIEALTGLRLENYGCLPDQICECCSIELAAAIKLRERCIAAQRELLMGLTEEQRQGISAFYRAAVMGEEISEAVKKYLPPDDEEVFATYQEIVLEEPKEEIDESKEFESTYYEVAEGNTGEDDGGSLIEEAEYESIMAEDEEQQHMELEDDTELIVGDVNDAYVYDSDDEVAVLDNVLDDEYEHENIVVKKCSLPPKPKTRSDDPRRRGTGGVYICEQCGNHIKGRMAFELHCRRHRGDKQFGCELCQSRFCTTSELKRHMRKHTGERPFACQYCGRCFTDYTTRVKHERTHTNERPYVCGTCGKAFTTGYILKNHMLIHSGERAYRCELCDKSFMLPTHLSTHFRSGVHKRHLEKAEMKQVLEQEQKRDLKEEEEDSLHI